MDRTLIEGTDLRVSPVCFGTYKLRDKANTSEALRLLGHAYETGVNFFDTSDNYPAEAILGIALRDGTLPKDDVVISTKTGLATSIYEAQDFHLRRIDKDTSAPRIKTQAENSLRVLGVEAIDLYQVHTYDPSIDPEEIAGAMNELIVEGKIKNWGVSNYEKKEDISRLIIKSEENGQEQPVVLQDFYNLLGRQSQEAIETARKLGMTVLATKPLYEGILTDNMFDEIELRKQQLEEQKAKGAISKKIKDAQFQIDVRESLKDLIPYMEEHEGGLQHLSIAWLMAQEKTIPIIGAYKREHFDDLIRAVGWKLDGEEMMSINLIVEDALAKAPKNKS